MRYRRHAFCSTPPGGGQVKSPPPTITDPFGACPHFPSSPDSKVDQAQAKTLLRTSACPGGHEWGGGGRRCLWGDAKLQPRPLVL